MIILFDFCSAHNKIAQYLQIMAENDTYSVGSIAHIVELYFTHMLTSLCMPTYLRYICSICGPPPPKKTPRPRGMYKTGVDMKSRLCLYLCRTKQEKDFPCEQTLHILLIEILGNRNVRINNATSKSEKRSHHKQTPRPSKMHSSLMRYLCPSVEWI